MSARVLVGCEFSGVLRDSFLALGHDAWSCDLLPTEAPGPHHQCDVREVLALGWDLAIFHPTCQYLCNSGVRWLYEKPGRWEAMREGAEFFRMLLNADIPRVAVENPVMHGHALAIVGERHAFSVQPYEHGDGETKRTCFWTRNLPPIVPTCIVEGRVAKVHRAAPSPDRWKIRSRTYPGIARALAQQWGSLLPER